MKNKSPHPAETGCGDNMVRQCCQDITPIFCGYIASSRFGRRCDKKFSDNKSPYDKAECIVLCNEQYNDDNKSDISIDHP